MLVVIKTCVYSWATSGGMQESVLHPCSFCGEDEGDDLSQQCDHFRGLTIFSAMLSSLSLLSLPPLVRAGLVHPFKANCALSVGAFLVHHSIKFQYLDVALKALQDQDPVPLVELTSRLA